MPGVCKEDDEILFQNIFSEDTGSKTRNGQTSNKILEGVLMTKLRCKSGGLGLPGLSSPFRPAPKCLTGFAGVFRAVVTKLRYNTAPLSKVGGHEIIHAVFRCDVETTTAQYAAHMPSKLAMPFSG